MGQRPEATRKEAEGSANSRLARPRATRSGLHAFGLNWDDTSGQNNGHFGPFNWKGP